MASPPRTATSPPYPIHASLPNPKKRGPPLQLGMGHAQKRHKPSARSISGSATSSAHPLRQTSFPPEESAQGGALRSPSVDSDLTGTQSGILPGSATTKKKPRGSKSAKNPARSSTQSVKSGGGGSGRRTSGKTPPTSNSLTQRRTSGPTRSPTTAPANVADYDDPDDEEDDDDDGGATNAPRLDDPDQKADREKLGLLIDAFDAEQFARYEMFRRVKFRKETVRKITNYVVSQSVPPSVVLTINGFAKTFVGVLIERARRVQSEAATAAAAAAAAATTTRRKREGGAEVEIDPTDFAGGGRGGAVPPVDPARLVFGADGRSGSARVIEEEEEEGELEHLGPLLPEHLREALRRYKRDGEGGGTGMAGVSVGLGVQGTAAARLQGRKLFR